MVKADFNPEMVENEQADVWISASLLDDSLAYYDMTPDLMLAGSVKKHDFRTLQDKRVDRVFHFGGLGESSSRKCLPKQMSGPECGSYGLLPDLFSASDYLFVSPAVAEILSRFELGGNVLSEVKMMDKNCEYH